MNRIGSNRWQIRAAVLGIFLLGFTAGALAMNVYYKRVSATEVASRQQRFARMIDQLQLTPEQRTKVEQILGDTRERLVVLRTESNPKMKEIHQDANERLRHVLTAEQWLHFQQIRDEHREQRRRGGQRGRNAG